MGIDRYLAIEDLFLSALPAPGQATIWHAIARRAGHGTRYKIYLNPLVYGADRAAEVVGEAMNRMGLGDCWETVSRKQTELAERGHRIEFLALDLDDSPKARVKVYYRHENTPFREPDTVASLAACHDSDRAEEVYRLFYDLRRTISNAPMTCLAFSGTGRPEHANVYLRLREPDCDASVDELMRREKILERPVVPGAAREFLSFRTTGSAGDRADVGVYMRFPQKRPAPDLGDLVLLSHGPGRARSLAAASAKDRRKWVLTGP